MENNNTTTTNNSTKQSGGCFSKIIIAFIIIGVIAVISSAFEHFTSSSKSNTGNNTTNIFNNTYNSNTTLNVNIETHPLVIYKDKGCCKHLTGDIALTTIFVDDPVYKWSNQDIKEKQANRDIYISNIVSQAKDYGLNLNIVAKDHYTVSLTEITDNNHSQWVDTVLGNARLPLSDSIEGYLESLYNVDEAPVMFFINKPGNSYYVRSSTDSGFEYAVIFNDDPDYRPYLYGMYGAIDYNTSSCKDVAEQYYSNSIMLDANSFATTDSLTAYILGWVDELDDEAVYFLNETSSTSNNSSSYQNDTNKNSSSNTSQNNQNSSHVVPAGSDVGPILTPQTPPTDTNGTYTGFQTIKQSGCTYSGHFLDGFKHGNGSIDFPNGDQFIGQWNYNIINGFGTYCFSNGDIYTGNFTNGKINGNGKYTWSNGDEYDGAWSNGKREGFGLMVYNNHTQVSGMWSNNDFLYAADH